MSSVEDKIKRLAKLNIRIEASEYVPDTELKRKTFKERFLSTPWRPWEAKKRVPCYKLFILTDGSVMVSPRVKAMIDDILLASPVTTV